MTPKTVFFSLFFSFASIFSQAQTIEPLRDEINQILKDKSATVAVAIQGTEMHDTLSINADRHMPMQSVFKFHLALAVLEQIDQGKLSLDHQLSFDKNRVDRYQHLYSPLREKYPQGANISVAELLKYTVSLSDNLGCDLLFQLVGAPKRSNRTSTKSESKTLPLFTTSCLCSRIGATSTRTGPQHMRPINCYSCFLKTAPSF